MVGVRTGHCLCGAVRIAVTNPPHDLGVCHCDSCRRWTGVATVSFGVDAADLTVTGAENVAAYASSDWAERCFCRICGSTLWYHLTIPDQSPSHYVAVGLLDDASGMSIGHEIFHDQKPDAFAFAGNSRKTTRAEFLASVGASPEE
ncbi:MAG: GFA family protein [Paracoccaceae bacterium]